MLSRSISRLMTGAIKAYRYLLSPWIGQQCRHHPSCSIYALEALERFGPARGGWLALKRVGRCHPLHPGGYDPVPDRTDAPGSNTRTT